MTKMLNENRQIDLREAVSLLGVSSATIRNWIRHKYLTPSGSNGKTSFDYLEVKMLKEKIANGEIDRLTKRANKRSSSNTFIPEEYADNENVIGFANTVADLYRTSLPNQKSVLLAVVLNLLQRKELITIKKDFDGIEAKNPIVQKEVAWWVDNRDKKIDFADYSELIGIELPNVSDILGLVYQSILAEGNKAQAGSYYTPKAIVDEIVKEYVRPNSLVLDPCCGTGQFLLSASDTVVNPSDVWGFDIDETAVRLARINLLAKFPKKNFYPNIYQKNTLLEVGTNSLFSQNDIPKFDVVITNPPWGVHFTQSETAQLQSIFTNIKSNEAFSYFIAQGLSLLEKNGVLSYILPEAILNVKTHADVRATLLDTTNIKKVKLLGRSFKNVFTPVIRLDAIKTTPTKDNAILVESETSSHKVSQTRLSNNQNYLFDVSTDTKDQSIIDKVYSREYITLKDQADWALGIVTGDNKKYILPKKEKNTEPILTGKDVKKFVFSEPKNFVEFAIDKFQQVAPEGKYRSPEKLIYKFISKDLVFSYDNRQTLTINSANILIPKIKEYPTKTILALFNSSLYQFVYQKRFNSIKVLRGNLEQLPLPKLTASEHGQINQSVELLLNKSLDGPERKTEYIRLDNLIMDLFQLTEPEKNYITSKTKISDKLLKTK